MPNIRDQSTVEAIARKFTGECKRNEEQALLAVGYSASYARSGIGHRVYSNIRVIEAIAEIDAKSAVKAEMTIERMHRQYDEDREFARKVNAAGAAVSASVSTARLYGMDKDAGGGEKTVIIISPRAPKSINNKEIEE